MEVLLLNALWLLKADQRRDGGMEMDMAKVVVIASVMCFNWRSHQQILFLHESFLKLVIMHFLMLLIICHTGQSLHWRSEKMN